MAVRQKWRGKKAQQRMSRLVEEIFSHHTKISSISSAVQNTRNTESARYKAILFLSHKSQSKVDSIVCCESEFSSTSAKWTDDRTPKKEPERRRIAGKIV